MSKRLQKSSNQFLLLELLLVCQMKSSVGAVGACYRGAHWVVLRCTHPRWQVGWHLRGRNSTTQPSDTRTEASCYYISTVEVTKQLHVLYCGEGSEGLTSQQLIARKHQWKNSTKIEKKYNLRYKHRLNTFTNNGTNYANNINGVIVIRS